MVTGIVLENEDIIDFGFVPYATRNAKQKEQKIDEEVSSIYLNKVSS